MGGGREGRTARAEAIVESGISRGHRNIPTQSARDLSSILMLPREQNPGQQYSRVISPKMAKSPEKHRGGPFVLQ